MKVTRQPFDPGPAAWNELLPPTPAYPALEGAQTADIVIIGAGFAGLSAARRLNQLDPMLKITVLEARRVAEGPAGRNSGFMIDLPHNLGSSSYAGGVEDDRRRTSVNRAAIAFVREAVAEYDIPAEAFSESGKINAAATEKGHNHNLDYARHLEALGEDCTLLDEHEMQAICGSSWYRGGLFTPGTAILQPAFYMKSLAAGLVRSGIAIHEHSPAMDLAKSGAGWRVVTPEGSISASNTILATNGHVESFGFFRRRLMHIYLYASMTAPLDAEQQRKLGGETRWGFTPADPMGTTVRKISGMGGTRIVLRNRFTWAPSRSVSPGKLNSIATTHDKSFRNRFPQIAGCPMEYRWGGLLCLSRNAVPAYGELEDGLFSACCQNGLGTAMGTASGMAIAERVSGTSSMISDHLASQPTPAKLPPEPFATLGANVLMRWKEFRANREL